jgi:hypothetical protein
VAYPRKRTSMTITGLIVLALAGCGDRSPAGSRMRTGDQAVIVEEIGDRSLIETQSASGLAFVDVGTRVTILDDDQESRVQTLKGDAGPRDYRKVRFRVEEGEQAGTVGRLWRFKLRPVAR